MLFIFHNLWDKNKHLYLWTTTMFQVTKLQRISWRFISTDKLEDGVEMQGGLAANRINNEKYDKKCIILVMCGNVVNFDCI